MRGAAPRAVNNNNENYLNIYCYYYIEMIKDPELRKQYMKEYYERNKERMNRQRLINYHQTKPPRSTSCGRKAFVDLTTLPPISRKTSS